MRISPRRNQSRFCTGSITERQQRPYGANASTCCAHLISRPNNTLPALIATDRTGRSYHFAILRMCPVVLQDQPFQEPFHGIRPCSVCVGETHERK